MLAFTLIHRHSDALPLSADVEGASSASETLTSLKNTAKSLLRRLSPGAQGGVMSSNYFAGGSSLLQIDMQNEATFVVLLDRGVLFLTVNAAAGCVGSPGSANAVGVAAAYLEEIAREFGEQFGEQVPSATRPFPFLRFDNFLSKTKKVYVGRNNSSSSSGGGIDNIRRQGAATAVKVSFWKIMGLVEPASASGSAGLPSLASVTGSGGNNNQVTVIAIGVGVLVLALLALYLIMAALS